MTDNLVEFSDSDIVGNVGQRVPPIIPAAVATTDTSDSPVSDGIVPLNSLLNNEINTTGGIDLDLDLDLDSPEIPINTKPVGNTILNHLQGQNAGPIRNPVRPPVDPVDSVSSSEANTMQRPVQRPVQRQAHRVVQRPAQRPAQRQSNRLSADRSTMERSMRDIARRHNLNQNTPQSQFQRSQRPQSLQRQQGPDRIQRSTEQFQNPNPNQTDIDDPAGIVDNGNGDNQVTQTPASDIDVDEALGMGGDRSHLTSLMGYSIPTSTLYLIILLILIAVFLFYMSMPAPKKKPKEEDEKDDEESDE